MAPPPFSMDSPKAPGGDGVPGPPQVFAATAADDPGYLASLRGGTDLGRLRAMMLVLLAAPVLILAIVPLIVQDGAGEDPSPLVYLPLVAAALVAASAGPRVPRPMRPGGDPAATAHAALMMFRQAVMLRFALAEGVILMGLPLAMIAHSEPVFVAGFVLGYPLLVRLALPTRGGVERIRRRLESAGAETHLWGALLSPPADGRRPIS